MGILWLGLPAGRGSWASSGSKGLDSDFFAGSDSDFFCRVWFGLFYVYIFGYLFLLQGRIRICIFLQGWIRGRSIVTWICFSEKKPSSCPLFLKNISFVSIYVHLCDLGRLYSFYFFLKRLLSGIRTDIKFSIRPTEYNHIK